VLVVMEDRDVELSAQPPFDLKAARRGDVLEVDPPKVGATAVTKAMISLTSLVSMVRRRAAKGTAASRYSSRVPRTQTGAPALRRGWAPLQRSVLSPRTRPPSART
jgi:hypothetical protein